MLDVHPLIWVGAGGALGGVLRVWLTAVVTARWGAVFPWGTLAVNLSGALLLGLLAGAWGLDVLLQQGPTASWWLLAVGVLGSYTTVSSFSLQTLTLLRSAEPWRGYLNIAGSLLGCLLAVSLGLIIGRLVAGGSL
ncbi:CrcB family protein [Halomonas salipaludis]|uniref:Fluoride-specific ion channel FluC n=1 Tax=Halomonas salipaludis TaxID=2032625 RepID=A0A2A2EYW6_9GAMM|nr:CrcB family protein [Halomonas salipaludis]PAU77559.1 chromosome condensation protein CrcB [Halomonas salipaludis]